MQAVLYRAINKGPSGGQTGQPMDFPYSIWGVELFVIYMRPNGHTQYYLSLFS